MNFVTNVSVDINAMISMKYRTASFAWTSEIDDNIENILNP